MLLELSNIGKRFRNEWIFKNVNLTIEQGNSCVVLGSNGSGKSTLLQVISGFMEATTGKIILRNNGVDIPDELHAQQVSYAAPYLELIEEFSLAELVDFHFKFKKPLNGKSTKEVIEHCGLSHVSDRLIKNFSSGMKQRVKLGLAFFSDNPLLLLDEPTANLDANGIAWFKENFSSLKKDRITIVCSNHINNEMELCDNQIELSTYK